MQTTISSTDEQFLAIKAGAKLARVNRSRFILMCIEASNLRPGFNAAAPKNTKSIMARSIELGLSRPEYYRYSAAVVAGEPEADALARIKGGRR